MQLQILLNLLIAIVWMLFHNTWTPTMFGLGYLVGLLLLFILHRFLSTPFYLRKIWAIVRLFFIFMRELILSCYTVLRAVIQPKLNIQPGIVAVPTQLQSDWEITLLACLVTLTPGTLTLEVSPEQDILYVHAMDASHADELIKQIQQTFESAIMEVTR